MKHQIRHTTIHKPLTMLRSLSWISCANSTKMLYESPVMYLFIPRLVVWITLSINLIFQTYNEVVSFINTHKSTPTGIVVVDNCESSTTFARQRLMDIVHLNTTGVYNLVVSIYRFIAVTDIFEEFVSTKDAQNTGWLITIRRLFVRISRSIQ